MDSVVRIWQEGERMMKKTTRMSVIVVAFTALAMGAAPLLATPLPTDGRIVHGKLPNGVTWMYRPHDNPPGKMAMMIHVDTGSLNETDAQRGLAHYLEHMAFNGTENFAPGELLPYFESIGMEFGHDLNAFIRRPTCSLPPIRKPLSWTRP